MNSTPLVSIVLPVYNGETYLKEAIESILKQSYSHWELIIVDDCSTDTSPSIINYYVQKDARISCIRNKKNSKLPASLNNGFHLAKGLYYTWTSDDNYYYPRAIEKMVKFLENYDEYGMVCSKFKIMSHPSDKYGSEEAITPLGLLQSNQCGACFLYRKNIAQVVGHYDENLFLIEDYDYWLRVLLEAPIGHINEELYAYRCHPKSLTSCNKYLVRRKYIEAISKHSEKYVEKFPTVAAYINTELALYRSLLEYNDELYSKVANNMSAKHIYRCLVFTYPIESHISILRKICQLRGIYRIKALNVWRKCLWGNI